MPYDPKTGVYYEIHGAGAPLVLGFPIMASYREIFGEANTAVLSGFLDRLTDHYRVLVIDYPSIGKSASMAPAELTAERACADMLSVADAAGFDRFAWWGYSWGAAVGWQLACRTDRLTAVVGGGWFALGGRHADMLRAVMAQIDDPSPSSQVVLREPAQYAQWAAFWGSLVDWPEAEAMARIACPRMVYVGTESDLDIVGVSIPYASVTHQRRGELERQGWCVVEIEGRGHEVGLEPAIVVPIVRDFLDQVIPHLTPDGERQ